MHAASLVVTPGRHRLKHRKIRGKEATREGEKGETHAEEKLDGRARGNELTLERKCVDAPGRLLVSLPTDVGKFRKRGEGKPRNNYLEGASHTLSGNATEQYGETSIR